MDNGAIWGWIGGIAGACIGLIGGVIGTYFSIKNTNGPMERRFMIGYAVAFWVVGLLFIGLLVLLPSPYRWFMWIPYSIIFPLVIIFGNRKLQRIRAEESAAQSSVDNSP